jgi:putative CocE/NonD family hydrolase
MGENVWRNEEQWPLERTRYTPFYLDSDGRANGGAGDGALLRGVTAPEEHADKFVYDPRDPVPTAGGAMIGPRGGIASQNEIEKRSDVLVYSTPVLDQDVETTGPVKAVLFVSTSAPHTDFTAKLVDVHPDGSIYNISEGILRRKYEPSNRPVPIEIDLWPTSMLFRRGHRIRLEISSSNYPRFDRNPNTGREIATETNPITASQIVYHGPENPSRLILPLIPRPAASRATK